MGDNLKRFFLLLARFRDDKPGSNTPIPVLSLSWNTGKEAMSQPMPSLLN
jgi:hypothetical protein